MNGREARTSQASTVVRDVVCELCCRSFRRESDKLRQMFGRETEASVRAARCNTVFTLPEVV